MIARTATVACFLLLTACAASGPSLPPAGFEPSYPSNAQAPLPAPGAIYRGGGTGGLSLFADQKARNVGDILTVQLVERTQASATSSTNTSKNSTVAVPAPTLFGAPTTIGGRTLDSELGAESEFDGSGNSSQSNRLDGSVTVTVAERLPNGYLVIRGQKWIRINQANEHIQIQGIVRPADIGPDNTILSSRVADAQIAYRGRGSLAQANAQGWLTRFFQSAAFPM
ncbi:flagellar basal body L-ring protein FlgH [Aquimonas voraii]|uniref:Flagellar L-ring protein n=1 Tax=Aquimonas voraii TaxID=265719 RepID=A0A1G6YED2_9GAMM|nr:flagellar basal body L-ring protein FlgH [Aquimonas voraii]SDD87916.1 flagellar L-ring protein precursor FlgH [Aquimonas voraii]